MPLRQTKYGGECPIGRFKIDVPAGGGCYDADPVEACFSCNFSDLTVKKFDPSEVCQCPADMSWPEYNKFREAYVRARPEEKRSRRDFWEFVKDTRVPEAATVEVR